MPFSSFLKKCVLIILCVLYSLSGKAQDATFVIPDSLKSTSYNEIFDAIDYKDTVTSKIYLNTYYKKAEIDDSDYRKAQALANLVYFTKVKVAKKELLDSAIYYSKKAKHYQYLMVCYSYAGGHHLDYFEYNKALDFYLMSLSLAQKNDNQYYIYTNKHNIAFIKSDIGDYDESIKLYKECYDKEVALGKNSYIYDYLITSIYLSETFIRNNQPDSANYYIDRALKKTDDSIPILKSQLKVYQSIANKKYLETAILLKKLDQKNVDLKRTLIIGHYYLGKNDIERNKENAEIHLKTIDSIFQQNHSFLPEVRMSYEQLIKHYKKYNDPKNQLEYVDKLLQFDSIYSKQKQIIGAKITSQYDTPTLLFEKEVLIQKLGTKNNRLNYWISILIGIALIFICIALYFSLRAKKLKHKFKMVMRSKEDTTEKNITHTIVKNDTKKELSISPDIITDVLKRLDTFEKNNMYVEKNITSSSLAKKLKTNSKYLSQIINHYKQKTIVTYINDLRVDYFITQIKEDPKLKQYTIQSIAEEVGFNSAESFSNAFYKKTGLKPSYFIKKMIVR